MYSSAAYTQTEWIDSVKKISETQQPDTNKVITFLNLSNAYQLYSPDSSFIYAQRALSLADKLHYDWGIFWSEATVNGALTILGNYPQQLDYAFKARELATKMNAPHELCVASAMLSNCYYNLGDFNTSLKYLREAMKLENQFLPDNRCYTFAPLSRIFIGLNQPDSALLYAKKVYEQLKSDSRLREDSYDRKALISAISPFMGNAFAGKGYYDSALFYYRMGIPMSTVAYIKTDLVDSYNGVAAVYKATGNYDSAIWYAEKVLAEKISKTYPAGMLKAVNTLADIYQVQNNADSSLKYLRMVVSLKDSLFNREKTTAVQNLVFREQEKQKEIETSRIRIQSEYEMYFLVAGLIAILIIAGVLYRNNRLRHLQNVRNSIADDLHDDIGSTLSSISIMSELAKQKLPHALPLLSSIGESTIAIQENMSDIIWTIKSEYDRFENVLQRMNQFASEILDAKNIELDFAADASVAASRLTMKQRKNIYLFFKEAINNAAKYSSAKKVSVCIAQSDHHIEMNIKDDGKGFDTAAMSDGNGMNNLKKRAAELNAHYKIISHINKGTVVQLHFKIT